MGTQNEDEHDDDNDFHVDGHDVEPVSKLCWMIWWITMETMDMEIMDDYGNYEMS